MVIQDVRREVDNKKFLKGLQQSQQGQWTNWEETLQNSITWKDIWHMAPLRLSFLIRSTYDQLSSKNNLFKWKKESNPTYPLCNDKPQTLEHVFSSCKTALGNERYTWRHNRVLDELVKFIKNCMKSEPTISTQKFDSESGWIYAAFKQTIKQRAVPGQNLLGSSGDWEVSADLPGWHNNYPKTISSKSHQPEIVLLSRANLKIIVVEQLIPYESGWIKAMSIKPTNVKI